MSDFGSDKNRRKFPRLNVRRAATVGIDGRQFVLATVNLGFGGAFLETDKQIGAGRIITFFMEIDGKQVGTSARIIHQNPHGMAIIFVQPPEEFVVALCEIISERIRLDATQGASVDERPGRVTLLVNERQNPGYEILFTSSLSRTGAWVMCRRVWDVGLRLWITLPEHGLFDCQAEVAWSDQQSMRLEFVDPSVEFARAYDRVLSSLAA